MGLIVRPTADGTVQLQYSLELATTTSGISIGSRAVATCWDIG
jgi:hypothetical protein